MLLVNVDIHTLITLLFFGNLIIALTMLSYQKEIIVKSPFFYFVFGRLLQVFAWLLFCFRGGISDILSIYLGNVILYAGFSFESIAIAKLCNSKYNWEKVFTIFIVLSFAGFIACSATPNSRVAFASITTSIIFSIASISMITMKPRRRLTSVIGSLYALFCIVILMRAYVAMRTKGEFGLLSQSYIQSISFIVFFLLMFLGSMGFILLLKSRDDLLLQESEEKYRTLVEKANEAIVILQNMNFAYVNNRMSKILDIPINELIGKPFISFVYEEDKELVIRNYNMRLRNENTIEMYDCRITSIQRKLFWVSISAVCIDWKGEPAILALLTDITEKKILEREKEQSLIELQKALSEVKTLSGLLPICSSCKKIRDDSGYWNQLETYFDEHSELKFSHGICPECAQKALPGNQSV